jgi:hypothetical protein
LYIIYRYWKIFTNTKVDWQVSFLSPLFSLTHLYHQSGSLHKLLYIIYKYWKIFTNTKVD